MAAAAHSGRDEIAAKAAQRILALYPAFEAEALVNFERWRFDAAVLRRLRQRAQGCGSRCYGTSRCPRLRG